MKIQKLQQAVIEARAKVDSISAELKTKEEGLTSEERFDLSWDMGLWEAFDVRRAAEDALIEKAKTETLKRFPSFRKVIEQAHDKDWLIQHSDVRREIIDMAMRLR